jgi:hypothetical protein
MLAAPFHSWRFATHCSNLPQQVNEDGVMLNVSRASAINIGSFAQTA